MFYSAAVMSILGNIREKNEDNYLFVNTVLPPNHSDDIAPKCSIGLTQLCPVFAVFDGIGGLVCGEIASYTAAKSIQQSVYGTFSFQYQSYSRWPRIVEYTNKQVYEKSLELRASNMGTTMAGIQLFGNKCKLINVGDSKIYLLRNSDFSQVSIDHLVSKQTGTGTQPKSYLLQYLGTDPYELKLEPQIDEIEIKRHDVFLICSDGITDMIPTEELKSILSSEITPPQLVKNLSQAALAKGGRDNATAIICKIL